MTPRAKTPKLRKGLLSLEMRRERPCTGCHDAAITGIAKHNEACAYGGERRYRGKVYTQPARRLGMVA